MASGELSGADLHVSPGIDTTSATVDITNNLSAIRERIVVAARRSGREPDKVTIIAVTKTMLVERIQAAVSAGLTDFGENRVQEAVVKFGKLRAEEMQARDKVCAGKQEIRLHLIGMLQRNKARQAAHLFDCIHSVDRVELLSALDRSVGEIGKSSLPVLLQVNVTREEAKGGIRVEDLDIIAEKLGSCENLRGIGLMTIARQGATERELRQTFSVLRELLESVKRSHAGEWSELSMGMSDDFEYAIEEGATMVRLGRVLFGERGFVTAPG